MSFVHVTRSGKTVETKNGVTTITKMQNGRKVTKTYNMNNMSAGTLIGDAGHVKIGSGTVQVQGRANSAKLGAQPTPSPGMANLRSDATPPAPVPANTMATQPANRQVRNQFNITGSVIGQVAIGNKGTTVFNNETKKFEAGSTNVDYKISGGNFSQANIGGEAHYNNKGGSIGAGDGYAGAGTGGGGGGLSVKQLCEWSGSEHAVLGILKTNISAQDFLRLLKKGYKILQIQEALRKAPNVKVMVNSMLQSDASPIVDSDDDTSTSDSD